jgi:hypothetical protein
MVLDSPPKIDEKLESAVLELPPAIVIPSSVAEPPIELLVPPAIVELVP